MRENKIMRITAPAALLLVVLASASLPLQASAESLFRANATYNADMGYRPRSLFAPPIPQQVGDIVTIVINETTQTQDRAELKIDRNRRTDTTGSSPYNQLLSFAFGKFGWGWTDKLADKLSGPVITDNGSTNTLNSKAEENRVTAFRDSITCQVVQVLPNGDLVVQGQKTIQVNKERQDMMVTGIVKPYYVNRNNQIPSNMVANFQMIRGGRGVISRQQNDGIANKINQFFN
ncbi:MAG TPA: flagellar basal body L-ring protein FlgH [Oculatellaceae cyanobacterium]|jgi:flagellar L-ring protein precursor FlgH